MYPLLLLLPLCISCVGASSVMCADGRTCPAGDVCVSLETATGAMPYCVDPAQLGCTVGEACQVGSAPGTCHEGGVCMPSECGNQLLDPGEQCDDGANASGDGCSADCRSTETCGNGEVDSIRGETCDDGAAGISSDGCSSTCGSEVLGWTEVFPRVMAARIGTEVVLDDARDRVLLFGGLTPETYSDETWAFDGARWAMLPTADVPPGRGHHMMTYDTARQRIVMFGGEGPGQVDLQDTWEWDGVSWRRMTPAMSPPPRRSGVLVYDAARGRSILFGGSTAGVPRQDHWEWDGTTWTSRTPANVPPANRSWAAYDPSRQVVVLVQSTGNVWEWNGTNWLERGAIPVSPGTSGFGWVGMTFDPTLGEILLEGASFGTHRYDGTTWNVVPSNGLFPFGHEFNGIAVCPTASCRVMSFGGDNFQYLMQAHTPRFSGSGWATVEIPPAVPAERSRHAAAYDSVRGELVIYGGGDRNCGTSHDDTWLWDETGWRAAPLGSTQNPLSQAAMAYDSARDRMVLFGGSTSTSCLDVSTNPQNVTLEWDGSVWVERTGVGTPVARTFPAMAFHQGSGRVVMFGGCGATTDGSCPGLGDTQVFDGNQWTVAAGVAPPPRGLASISYDVRRDRVVLFGGISGTAVLGDTWEWDGQTWTQRTSATAPSARYAAAMTYDLLRGVTVLYQGVGSDLREVWEWDGNDWQVVPAQGFVLNVDSMVYDSVQRRIVTFGGEGPYLSVLARTHVLEYRPETNVRERCIDATDDYDEDGLAGCEDPDCFGRCTPLCPPGAFAGCVSSRCGDGTCNAREDRRLCPTDCT